MNLPKLGISNLVLLLRFAATLISLIRDVKEKKGTLLRRILNALSLINEVAIVSESYQVAYQELLDLDEEERQQLRNILIAEFDIRHEAADQLVDDCLGFVSVLANLIEKIKAARP